MKITAIKQQVKRSDRYSIFVDSKYAFSLSDAALLESKLTNGQELDSAQLRELKNLSDDDKLYNLTLSYIALRPRTKWEVETYLARKKASPSLTTNILNMLSNKGLLDDEKFARAYVNDRQLLRPTSRRKMIMELRKKHVKDEIIRQVTDYETTGEQAALQAIIANKRQQTRYQNDLKLMQYLARQGFNYGDIKEALQQNNTN